MRLIIINACALRLVFFAYLAIGVWPQAQTQTDAQIIKFYASAGGTASGQGTFPRSMNLAGDVAKSRGFYTDAIGAYHGFLRIPNHGTISKDQSKNEIGRDAKLELRD